MGQSWAGEMRWFGGVRSWRSAANFKRRAFLDSRCTPCKAAGWEATPCDIAASHRLEYDTMGSRFRLHQILNRGIKLEN
ncbi:predicted protein [Chaetomium globosum CBS 148.51]|uniref:Uncharacterized protein n=1 Tax=Chaetomium globosum (strain ATCC 6205 / CBS 148.51 / DSM 1962 / NBRC 6347 / NRRL 1970) TaxID=306901 RepID=Q2GP07_CHAGB|nr:uncharacterized protein CHGG_10297 [Chaetomium globosum CBS 148.51]EAQ83893.1 predicted protein [Chaetomium globosum CBS 148.51]